MTELNTESTVAEWVAKYPQTARVFEDLRIDYCCNGKLALAEACEQSQLDASDTVEKLAASIATAARPVEDWNGTTLGNLCDHIQQTHHAYLRQELPRLAMLLEKVLLAHGDRHPELSELQEVFFALRSELEPHMLKEEQILFPAIRQMEMGAECPSFPFGTVANPIHMMEHEHDLAGDALAQIRRLTSDFTPPDDACNTYQVLFDSLSVLERDMHQHIHKENNILFPRAQELESNLAAT